MKLSALAETIGIASVVLSLIFVGYEIRQNTQATSAQAILEITALMGDQMNFYAQDPAYVDIQIAAEDSIEGLENLSRSERYRFWSATYSKWNVFEAAHVFHRKGLIEDSDFVSWTGAMCYWYLRPSDRALIDNKEIILLDSLVTYLDNNCGES